MPLPEFTPLPPAAPVPFAFVPLAVVLEPFPFEPFAAPAFPPYPLPPPGPATPAPELAGAPCDVPLPASDALVPKPRCFAGALSMSTAARMRSATNAAASTQM